MTKDQILAMKPGIKLDMLISEKVMNLRINGKLKHYSQDISAVWEVAEKMNISVICSEDGWYAVVTDDIIHRHSHEHKYKEVYGKHWALANNVPEAICKAALCAVLDGGEEVE